MSKKNPFKQNKSEIIYNIINGAMAGLLVLLGSFTSGEVTTKGCLLAILASLVVFVTKFKEYWDGEKGEYSKKMFNFVTPISL